MDSQNIVMSPLDAEITRWIKSMEKKGYFRLFTDEQAADIQNGFRKYAHDVYAQNRQIVSDINPYGIGFEIQGRLREIKWFADMHFRFDHKNTIILESSNLSLKNPDTGIKLAISSSKSLLDLETFLILGTYLPEKSNIHIIQRHPRVILPPNKRGKGPNLN